MISKYLAYNEKVSVIYAETTELIEYIRKLQNLTYLTTRIMAKFYTISGMMAFSDMKEESDEIVINLKGEGVSGLLYSDLKLKNNKVILKGFIENPQIDLKNHNSEIDFSDIIGKKGNLTVIKNNKYTKVGYKGITPLISGNVVDDFKNYYENSTQKPVFLDLKTIEEHGKLKCVGYLITFMPDATAEDILKIQKNIEVNSKSINYNNDSFEFVKNITGDNNIKSIDNYLDIVYRCDCNKEKYRDMLLTLKKSELEEILKEDGKINIVCQYCNKSYDFSQSELEEIVNSLK